MNICDYIRENKIIAICRKIYGDDLLRLAEALYKGGVRMMEVTFDQNDPNHLTKTAEAITLLCAHFGEEMKFGAGTVLSADQVTAAREAGALYIISPNTDAEVINSTKAMGLVSIPGAMTPSEILSAHNSGADFVKLFPATRLGFDYIKDILAPISHVGLVATGGVNEGNFGQYLAMGFVGAGISGRLTDKKLIAEGNFAEITRRAQVFSELSAKS